MGHRFSHFRGPQVTLEGNAHALIRVGWDSQYEHEHGLTPEFVDIASGGRVAKLEANEWFTLAADRLTFQVFRMLWTCWIGRGPGAPDFPDRVWTHEGPMTMHRNGTGVEVSWYDSAITLWCVPDSPVWERLKPALQGGRAVLGLLPRVNDPRPWAGPEPVIATSDSFFLSVADGRAAALKAGSPGA